MDTVQDLEFAHGEEVEIHVGNSGSYHVVPPVRQQPQRPPPPPPPPPPTSIKPVYAQAPTGSLVAPPPVSMPAQTLAPVFSCTAGPTSFTPAGLQLGSGLPLGADPRTVSPTPRDTLLFFPTLTPTTLPDPPNYDVTPILSTNHGQMGSVSSSSIYTSSLGSVDFWCKMRTEWSFVDVIVATLS